MNTVSKIAIVAFIGCFSVYAGSCEEHYTKGATPSQTLAPTVEPVGVYAHSVGYGDERWDKDVDSFKTLEDLEGFRASRQSGLNRIWRGAKGMFAIPVVMAFNQLVWDPPIFSREHWDLHEMKRNIDKHHMRIYVPEWQRERPWYQNIFTVSFIGDNILKNIGVFVGIIASCIILLCQIGYIMYLLYWLCHAVNRGIHNRGTT